MNRLEARLWAQGRPLRVDEFVEAALYDPEDGFYGSGRGRPGRRGDFLTSPEVGPLFGAVLASALEGWWREAGEPPTFTVVEAGAGAGTLARAVLAAKPEVPLTYVAVERSAPLRSSHPEGVASRSSLPEEPFVGVVVANELLDNLPFRLLDPDGEVFVTASGEEVLRPCELTLPAQGRIPAQEAAAAWLAEARQRLVEGRVVVIDYGSDTAELERRPWGEWVRTYRAHGPGGPPFADPGTQDITCEVAWDQLAAVALPTRRRPQADALVAWGIEELVEEGRRTWAGRASVADLEAMTARSRVREAEALLDPAGLGRFDVVEWEV